MRLEPYHFSYDQLSSFSLDELYSLRTDCNMLISETEEEMQALSNELRSRINEMSGEIGQLGNQRALIEAVINEKETGSV